MSYNGWTNYETWNVKLWMDNDEGSQGYWEERTQDVCDSANHDKDESAYNLAKELESEHRENMPEVSGTYADLLSSALDAVNWQEIAESMVEDYESNREPDED